MLLHLLDNVTIPEGSYGGAPGSGSAMIMKVRLEVDDADAARAFGGGGYNLVPVIRLIGKPPGLTDYGIQGSFKGSGSSADGDMNGYIAYLNADGLTSTRTFIYPYLLLVVYGTVAAGEAPRVSAAVGIGARLRRAVVEAAAPWAPYPAGTDLLRSNAAIWA